MVEHVIDPETNRVAKLLTTIWTQDDDEVLTFLSRNKTFLDRTVKFTCLRSYGILCDDCVENGLLSGCDGCRQVACCCAEELEVLPLSVDDKQQLRRLCINAYVGACPHAVCVSKGENGLLTKSFLQDKMPNYYADAEMDLDYNAEKVKSSSLELFRCTDVLMMAGTYLEHILLRLGKIHLLTRVMNNHLPKKKRYRRTFRHGYTVLQLALIFDEIEFFMSDFKQKIKRGKGTLLNNCTMLRCEFSRTENDNILRLSMTKNVMKVFCKTLKALKKIQRLDKFGIQQRILRQTLWTSVIDSKVEYTRILIQSNMITFYRLYNPSGERCKELALSKMIQNNNSEVLDMLIYNPDFSTNMYISKLMVLAVSFGNVGMFQKLLCAFKRFYNGKTVKAIDIYTLAVLKDDMEILALLVDHNIPAFHMDHVRFGALDFATCFQRERCSEMLRNAGHVCFANTLDTSPLLEVQKLEDPPSSNRSYLRILSFDKLIEELVNQGFDVNFDNQNGITPVQMAIRRRDYPTVRMLLQNGADLFRGQSYMMEYGTMRLVTEIFYCNVDIFDHVSTIIELVKRITLLTRGPANWAVQKINREQLTYSFISDCVHSLSAMDKMALARDSKEYESQDIIRPLEYQCRMRLRRHFGRNIHRYASMITIPESIHRYLLLSNEIDAFKSQIRWEIKDE